MRDHPLLGALSAGAAALEALAVVTIGPHSGAALAPQVIAPAPYGVFHDLRWLLVYHQSWPMFVAEVALLIGIRTALDLTLTRAAWPASVPRPEWRAQAAHLARFTAIQALVLLPFAVLTFAMAAMSLSWLFLVATPVLVMVAVLVHHGTVEPRWWRDRPPRGSVLAVFATFGVLTVAGGVIAEVPTWAAPLLALPAGLAVAACRLRLVTELAGPDLPEVPRRRLHWSPPLRSGSFGGGRQSRRRPFVAVGLAAIVALVVGGTAVGFAVSVAVEDARTLLPVEPARASGPPVLVVKGFNSEWDGVTRQWVHGHYRIRRFSYRGLGTDAKPRPYGRSDTHRSVPSLVRLMRRQVDAFHAATGQAVSLVAESEGSLVTQAYLAATPRAPVRAVVLLSPLLAPGRVYYPRLGDSGWGVAAATVMDGITLGLGGVGPVKVSPDTALFRSMVDEEPALGRLLACPPPGIRSYAVLPLDSGLSATAPTDVGYAHAVVPAFHGGLLGNGTAADLLGRVLRGEPAHGSGLWSFAADVVNAGAAAWQAPSLVRGLEPRWSGGTGCRAVRAEIRRFVRTGSG